MESGLLNLHDEENFTTSIYDQGELCVMDGHSSLLDMMHSDFQYHSDYLTQSTIQWDSDQEQEHNGDIAVLPTPPSECSSLNSSKEDYHKVFFEWQEHLLSLQPLEPDDVDLCLDGQTVTEQLPDNIFEDSIEFNSSITSVISKSSSRDAPIPLNRSSTPVRQCLVSSPQNKSSGSLDESSLNLDVSLSSLDVDVTGIDVSALGIDVSALDLKSDHIDLKNVNLLFSPDNLDLPESEGVKPLSQEEFLECNESKSNGSIKVEPADKTPLVNSVVCDSSLAMPLKIEPDVLTALTLPSNTLPCLKQGQSLTQASETEPGIPNSSDSGACQAPVLEAGNLESLLEQFEASLLSGPTSQSMPASPAHVSFPSSSISMPASPSAPGSDSIVQHKFSKLMQSIKPKVSKTSGKQSSPAKLTSLLRSNNKDTPMAPNVVVKDKIVGKKKMISVIPALPNKKSNKSGTRMQDAGYTLNRNKLLKIVTQKGTNGESVQLDHDYCSNDSHPSFYNADPLEYIPENLVLSIRANQRHVTFDDDKSSRKDSGLESGEVSEDSEGTVIHSGGSSGCETAGSILSNISLRPFKSKGLHGAGRTKDLLMVSVLKKTKHDVQKSLVESSKPIVGSNLPPKPEVAPVVQPVVLQTSLSCVTSANEPPKKRKLNLEEYRNRQKALEREREKNEVTTVHDKTITSKPEPRTVSQEITSQSAEPQAAESPMVSEKEELVVKLEVPICEPVEEPTKCTEDKRRRRQYRVRRSSSSSSEGHIQKPVVSEKLPIKTKVKRMWSRSRSRSRLSSCSSTSSRSRSSSSSSSSSCSSSSSSSSSRSSSIKSSSGSSCCSGTRRPTRRKNSYESRSRSRSRRRSRRSRSRNRSRDSSRGRRWGSKNRDSKRSHASYRSVRRRSRSSSKSWTQSYRRLRSCSSSSSSRSRSGRRTRSRSLDRSRSRTRSRSCHRARRWSRSNCRSIGWRDKSRRSNGGSRRSRSPRWRRQGSVDWFKVEKEHNRQVEERRVIYVGRIPDNITKADLRSRFEGFGPVVDVSLHFREHADNYGFVTFAYKVDAYEAVEHGNDDPNYPRFDLCFGGRRKFCKERYADLDGMACEKDFHRLHGNLNGNSFDQMLREAQAKLRDRKKV